MCSLDDVRIGLVRLAALAELDVAGVLQARRPRPVERLALELGEADAADRRVRPGEAELDHLGREPDDVEDLGAAVRRDVGDAHLGHDLEDASSTAARKRRCASSGEGRSPPTLSACGERGHRLEREPRADRLRAVAEQAGEVVCLARLVGLDHERGERPQTARDESVVDGADRHQHRNRRAGAGVRDHERSPPGAHRRLGLVREPHAGAVQVGLEGRVEPRVAERLERVRVEEEALELGPAGGLGPFRQQRRAAAEDRPQGELVALAEVVDRRVRHLGEALPEVRVERPRAPGERRQRGVVAHRRGRLVAAAGDRPQDHVHVLARVAEARLARGQVALRRLHGRAVAPGQQPVGEPAAVGAARGEPRLIARVLLEAALGVDGDRSARGRAARAAPGRAPRGRPRRPRSSRRRGRPRRRRSAGAAARCGRAPRRPRARP